MNHRVASAMKLGWRKHHRRPTIFIGEIFSIPKRVSIRRQIDLNTSTATRSGHDPAPPDDCSTPQHRHRWRGKPPQIDDQLPYEAQKSEKEKEKKNPLAVAPRTAITGEAWNKIIKKLKVNVIKRKREPLTHNNMKNLFVILWEKFIKLNIPSVLKYKMF